MTAGNRRRRLRTGHVPGHVPLCPKCGKRAFSSRRAARIAALIWHPTTRMYAYPHCGRWHISSETYRDRLWRPAPGRRAA